MRSAATPGHDSSKARDAVVAFCGALAAIGLAAAPLIAATSKQATSSPWFVLSVVVAVVATTFLVLAGLPSLVSWFADGIGRLRRKK